MATGKLSNEVYRNYFLAGGNWWSLIFLTAALIIGQLSASGTDYWVTYWTNEEMLRVSLQSNQSDADHMKKFNETIGNRQDINFTEPQSWLDENGLIRRNIGINIYTICVFTCILFNLLSGLLFVRLCMCASRSIHESMFTNLLQSTMQFFNTNPSGKFDTYSYLANYIRWYLQSRSFLRNYWGYSFETYLYYRFWVRESLTCFLLH